MDSLWCTLCYEPYDEGNRIPVLLDQCGHSFCRGGPRVEYPDDMQHIYFSFLCSPASSPGTVCLQTSHAQCKTCPRCKQTLNRSTSALRPNYALIQALEALNASDDGTDGHKLSPFFSTSEVSWADILASGMSGSVLSSILEKLEVAGFNTKRYSPGTLTDKCFCTTGKHACMLFDTKQGAG